jgi:nucleoside-diphosphate-sugar epimerase
MRILFTGASSGVGRCVLERLLASADDIEVWCTRHRGDIGVADSRVCIIDLNLAEPFDAQLLPDAIDMVIHFAGVTHARDVETYWNVNLDGTKRLAEYARARGCRRFVYISTRCAVEGAGAYGESKLAAENEIKKFSWDGLLIIRPSEIYGGQGREGLDKLIALAQRWHLTAVPFGTSNIEFSPLHLEDFAVIVTEEIIALPKRPKGLRIVELCGPEDLSATVLATRIARRYKALPIPVWWPLFALSLKIASGLSLDLTVPDQLPRLVCAKTGSAKSADRTGCIRFLREQ